MQYYLKSAVLNDDRTARGEDGPLDGVHTRIVKNAWADDLIWRLFGRVRCCLKIFKQPYTSLSEMTWSNGTAVEATIAQNLAAMEGLAPRVYGLVKLCAASADECHLAQVTDFVEGEHGYDADLRGKLSEFRKRNPWLGVCWDMNPKNAKGGLWTDWGIWRVKDAAAYEESLRERATDAADWGSRSEAYQSALGCPSQRDLGHRLGVMGLKDVHDKTVLDLGCNLGDFVRWAEEHGARRAWGVDLPHVAAVGREVANWCRAWNADLVSLKLPKGDGRALGMIREACGRDAFNVVLALAVDRQIGYGYWMRELVRPGGVFWLEGHVPDKRETYEDVLKAGWDEVEFIGTTRDHGPRPVFRCRRS